MKIKSIKRKIKNNCGQATIELAVMFPVIIIIAVILVNALTFFSECSKFDRLFKQEVCALTTSPAYGENLSNTKAALDTYINKQFDKNFLEYSSYVEGISGNYIRFSATLKLYPTLFGLNLSREIFGVPLPSLNHKQQINIKSYKPGVIF